MLVLIKGAGDLATGVAHRLYGVGVSVVMTELEAPTAVRRGVAFSQCIYDGVAEVEGVTARRAEGLQEVSEILGRGDVAVLADPTAAIRDKLPFAAVIDAVLAKRNTGTRITDAPVVIALGPGFTAGKDCHGVVETWRDIPHSGYCGFQQMGSLNLWPLLEILWTLGNRWPGLQGSRSDPASAAWCGDCCRAVSL